MAQIEIDNLYIRDNKDYWAVGGRAINWDTPSLVKDFDSNTGQIKAEYLEEFAPNSIMIPASGAILRDEHGQDVGLLTRSDTTNDGWDVELQIDKTDAGARVRKEIKEGKKHAFSIGMVENSLTTVYDKARNVYRHTKALVKEISVTGSPQHLKTEIAYVRSNPIKETKMDESQNDNPENNGDAGAQAPTTPTNENLLTRAEFTNSMRDLRGEISSAVLTRSTPQIDTRSPGEFFRDLAKGDDATVTSYENLLKRSNSDLVAAGEEIRKRAFPTEGVIATSISLPGWAGDLTRLVNEPAILLNAFSTGTLPGEGMTVEYGALASDATVVDEQSAEGDDLDYGYVDVEVKSAPVITYGGYSRLSRQAIERSSVPYLDTLLRAMALRAGKRINTRMRTALEVALAAQVTASRKVTIADETSWEEITDGIIDAVDLLLDEGLGADALIVDKPSFKVLKNMVAADGRSQMLLDGAGVNNIGTLSLAGISGRLAGIQVICDPNWSYNPASTPTNNMALVNKDAIRFRSSGITQLTDENIVNLSKDFALYFYAAIATEIPKGVVPIELTL